MTEFNSEDCAAITLSLFQSAIIAENKGFLLTAANCWRLGSIAAQGIKGLGTIISKEHVAKHENLLYLYARPWLIGEDMVSNFDYR